MYNIPQHNLRNEALMLRDFHINSPYGRLGKHPPQGRWEGYVENFQYNQALGVAPLMEEESTGRRSRGRTAWDLGRRVPCVSNTLDR
jgi:hypothetical protein